MRDAAHAGELCAHAWREHRAGRTDAALAGFRRVLTLDPTSLSARFGLSTLLLDRGDAPGAAAVMAGMSAANASHPEILWLRARIAMAQRNAHAANEAVARLLDHPGLDDAQRAEALLLRGLALEELGEVGPAFSAALDGKRLQRAIHAGPASAREGEVAKLRRIAGWMADAPRLPSPRLHPSPAAADTHIFLLGFPRSGTTLLEQVLAAHPRVDTLEEEGTLATAYQAFLADAAACASLERLGDEEAQAWADHYWSTVRKHGFAPAGRVFVDKQPAGTLWLPIIARLFPDAKILFALRDPRDVVLSCFRQAFQMNAMTYCFTDLAETAACYDACMRLAETARAKLPPAWADVRHEALVEDFEGELARILDFLGLDDDPALRDFARLAQGRAIRTPSAPQVRAGLNRRGLGRWRQYERELGPILPLLAPWVERFGYAD